MQSKVEDVNSAIVTYRQVALRAREEYDYRKAKLAINCLRATLMPEFAVEYSEYVTLKDLDSEYRVVECTCGETVKLVNGIQHDISQSGYRMVPVLVPTAVRRFVTCEKCNTVVRFSEKDIFLQKEVKSVQLIPKPPVIQDMITKIYKEGEFWDWFDTIWEILEKKHFLQRLHVSVSEEQD